MKKILLLAVISAFVMSAQATVVPTAKMITHRDSSIVYYGDGSLQSKGKFEYQRTFNAQGHKTAMTGYAWKNNTWTESGLTDSIYDTKGRLTSYQYSTWSTKDASWVYQQRFDYTYDAQGKMTQSIGYSWNKTTSEWRKGMKNDYTYDAQGNQIQRISYSWNNTTSEYTKSAKLDWTYDAQGNQTQQISYNWDKTASKFVESQKVDWTYDAQGNQTQSFTYSWNKTTSKWVESSKTDYTYDAQGNREGTTYNWDGTLWNKSTKSFSYYDAWGNTINIISYQWNSTKSDWEPSTYNHITYTYYSPAGLQLSTNGGTCTVAAEENLVVPEGVAVHGLKFDSKDNYMDYVNAEPYAPATVLPAGKGFLATAMDGFFFFPVTKNAATKDVTSCLNGFDKDSLVAGNVYVFADATEGKGFYKPIADGKVKANTGYFKAPDTLKEYFISLGKRSAVSEIITQKDSTVNLKADGTLSSKNKYEYQYDAQGTMTQQINYSWNATTSAWVESKKFDYTYDAQGNQTQSIQYTWDKTTSKWKVNRKYDYTYDAQGNQTQEMMYSWNKTTSAWVESLKTDYTYDAQGNQIQKIEFSWGSVTSAWCESVKFDYTYDAQGTMTQLISYKWNATTSKWEEFEKIKYTYDAQGNQTQQISYNWDKTASKFVESQKVDWTYDAQGNQIQKIQFSWDSTTSTWVKSYKFDYTYDAQGNQTQQISYSWNATTSAWVESQKFDYTYDAQGNQTQQIQYSWDTTDWNRRTASYIYYSVAMNVVNVPYDETFTIYNDFNTLVPAKTDVHGMAYDEKGNYLYYTNTEAYPESTVLPANMGFIVKAKKGNYTFYKAPDAPSAKAEGKAITSCLKGVTKSTDVTEITGGIVFLLGNDTKGEGFYKTTEGTIASNTAFFLAPSTTKVDFISFDAPTGVQQINDNDNDNDNVYNLQGMKVDANYKGIVIKNGKKYLMK